MYEIFVMNWEHRQECAESFKNWSKNKKGLYIDLSDDYENVWSIRDKNEHEVFNDYLSGYVVSFKDTFKYYHNASELNELLKNLREGKDYIYYNLKNDEKYTIADKIKAGDTCLLTKKDMNILEKVLEKHPEILDELEPKDNIVPFEWEDKESLIGKIVKTKDNCQYAMVTEASFEPMTATTTFTIGNQTVQTEDLFSDYTFTDGSICGKKLGTDRILED